MTTTNNTNATTNEVNPVGFSDLTHAGQCLDVYLNNDSHIYENCTMKAIAAMVNDGLSINTPEVNTHINRAINMAAGYVCKYDHLTPTAADIEQVKRDYYAYIIECAQYGKKTVNA